MKTSFLPGVGDLFLQSWGSYWSRWKTYTGIQLMGIGLGLLAGLVGLGGFFLFGFPTVQQSWQTENIAWLVVLIIVFVVVSIWLQSSLAYAVTHAPEGVGIKNSLREGWSRAGRYLWISFLASLATLVGFLLLIIPGIIIGVWFVFPIVVYMVEGDRGTVALRKSREYVRGYWWAVFGRLVVLFIFLGAISIVPAIFILADSPALNAIELVYRFALQFFTLPFLSVYIFTLYGHLKQAKASLTQT